MSATAPVRGVTARHGNGQVGRPVRVVGARQRPVPWIALAVLLVVGGALLAWLVVQSAADRSSVLVAARSLSPGHVLESADLRVVDVGVEGEAAVIPASEREGLTGQVVVAAIPEGALISPGQSRPTVVCRRERSWSAPSWGRVSYRCRTFGRATSSRWSQ
jgi:flagella basal body P-ring formation protein FlgA